MLVKEPSPRVMLYGTNGSFIKYGLDIQEELLKNNEYPTDNTWGLETKSTYGILNTISERKYIKSERGDYRDYYLNIYNSIINNELLIVSANDGLNTILIIEAALKSNFEKRRIQIKK